MKLMWQNPANLWDLGDGSSLYSSLYCCVGLKIFIMKMFSKRGANLT